MKQIRAILIGLSVSPILVNAVEVVQKDIPTVVPSEPSAWSYIVPFLIGMLILMIVLGILTYIIYRILKWLKQRESEFHNIIEQKRDLARKHSSKQYYRSYFKKTKNAPIKCLYKNSEGHLKTTIVGFYYGHYYASRGNLYIAFSNSPLHWALWFIPKVELLMVNKNPYRRLKVKEEMKRTPSGKDRMEVTEVEVNLPTNIEHFQDDEIILWAYGIDNLRTGEDVYVPVLFNEKTGEVIKSDVFLYSQLQDVLLQDVLFTQAEGYSKNTKKAIDFNASIKASQKLSDTNAEVQNEQ
jgi:hypothetical protein